MKKLLFVFIALILTSTSYAQLNLGKKLKQVEKALKPSSKLTPTIHFSTVRSPAGIAYDPNGDKLYAYGVNSFFIDIYQTNGQLADEENIPFETVFKTALNSYDKPAKTASLGMDFAPESFKLGETAVPANSLLLFNGEERTREITAVNKQTGQVIAGMDIPNGRYVGGVYSNTRNTLFLIDSANDDIIEIDPATGKEKSRFDINDNAARKLNIFGGSIEIDDQTDQIYVVTDGPTVIRVFDLNGTFIRDYELDAILEKPALIQAIQGIVFDKDGNLWIASSGGRRISLMKGMIK